MSNDTDNNDKRKKRIKGPVAALLILILICAVLPLFVVRLVEHALCLDSSQGLQAPPGVTLPKGEIVSSPSINAVTILWEFQQRGSPAELQTMDMASHIVDDSVQYQIDDAFAVALWAEETQDGRTAIAGTRNIGNMTGPTGVHAVGHIFTIFPTWEAGIDAWFQQAARYAQRGLTDVQSFSLYYVDGILNPTSAQIANRQDYINGIHSITETMRSHNGSPNNNPGSGSSTPDGITSVLNEIMAGMPQYWATIKAAQLLKSAGLFVSCIYNRYVKAAWNLALRLVQATVKQAVSLAGKFVDWAVAPAEQFSAWIADGAEWTAKTLQWIEDHTGYFGRALRWLLGEDGPALIKMGLLSTTDPLTMLSHSGVVLASDFVGSVFSTATGQDLPISYLESSPLSWWQDYQKLGPSRIKAGPGGGLPQPGDTVVVDDSAEGGSGHVATVMGVEAPQDGQDGYMVVAQSDATNVLDAWTIHPDLTVDTNWSYHPKVLGYIRPADLSLSIVPGSASAAIQYADSHWNWPYYTRSTPAVPSGVFQPDFQCAEFVARALSAAGLIPGLNPNSPQTGPQSFASYRAPNGKTYYLWNVGRSHIPGLYQYLIESGLGVDIGNNPTLASPGDVVFYYGGGTLAPDDRTHTALMVQTGAEARDALVDAHNAAHYHYPYAMEHPLTIVHLKYALPTSTATPTPGPQTTITPGNAVPFTQFDLYQVWQPSLEAAHRSRTFIVVVSMLAASNLTKGRV
jgi:hypothetical protein